MTLADLGHTVAQFAPLLGKLLPIPGAGIAGDLIASAFGVKNDPQAIAMAVNNDPDAAVKLAKIEADNRALLQQQVLSAETARIQTVNTTMRAESKSEHWPQWSWRPFNGFAFGVTAFGAYFVLPLVHIVPPDIPSNLWMMWGSILGVAAWHRGAQQREVVGGGNGLVKIVHALKK